MVNNIINGIFIGLSIFWLVKLIIIFVEDFVLDKKRRSPWA